MASPPDDDPPRPSPSPPGERPSRRLSEAPAARYRAGTDAARPGASAASALAGPLRHAAGAAVLGAAALALVGGILASTFGLLFVAAASGAIIGLTLSRAAVPADDAVAPVPRARLKRLAVALALGAVAAGAVGTWLVALAEGGTLGIIDYLLTTFGPFLPAEAVLATLGAWWGATSGPIHG